MFQKTRIPLKEKKNIPFRAKGYDQISKIQEIQTTA